MIGIVFCNIEYWINNIEFNRFAACLLAKTFLLLEMINTFIKNKIYTN